MVERIKALCVRDGTNFSAVEKELGFANASIKKMNEKSSADRVYALAKRFDVSMEYIYSGEKRERLSASEKELISLFRKMNGDGRATLLSLAESMAMNEAYQSGKKLSESHTA